MSSIDGGDAPTWLGTLFAAAAATAAIWTIASQRQQIAEQRQFIGEQSATMALERAELQAAGEERRWAQARLVRLAANVGGDSDTDTFGNQRQRPANHEREGAVRPGLRGQHSGDQRDRPAPRGGRHPQSEVQLLEPDLGAHDTHHVRESGVG